MMFLNYLIMVKLFCSVGSLGGSTVGSTSRPGSVRAKKTKAWLIPDSLNKLYELLIAPFEDFLFAPCG
jgi:hypothetical protein